MAQFWDYGKTLVNFAAAKDVMQAPSPTARERALRDIPKNGREGEI